MAVFKFSALDLPTVGSPIFLPSKEMEENAMRFHIPKMSCGGCAESIEAAIRSVDPQATVAPDLKGRTVEVVTGEPRAALEAALATAG